MRFSLFCLSIFLLSSCEQQDQAVPDFATPELRLYEYCLESAIRVQVVRKESYSRARADLMCGLAREAAVLSLNQANRMQSILNQSRDRAFAEAANIYIGKERP